LYSCFVSSKTSLFLAKAISFDMASVFISIKFFTSLSFFIEVIIPFSGLLFVFLSSTPKIIFNFCSTTAGSSTTLFSKKR
jgi:hypothetical protein